MHSPESLVSIHLRHDLIRRFAHKRGGELPIVPGIERSGVDDYDRHLVRPPPIIILGHEWGPIFRWQRHFGLVEWRADYQVPQLRSFANWQSSCCSIGGRIEQLAHLFGAGAKERQLAEDLPPRVVLSDHGQLLL